MKDSILELWKKFMEPLLWNIFIPTKPLGKAIKPMPFSIQIQISYKRNALMRVNLSSSLLIVDGGNQISQKLVIASFDWHPGKLMARPHWMCISFAQEIAIDFQVALDLKYVKHINYVTGRQTVNESKDNPIYFALYAAPTAAATWLGWFIVPR